MNNDEGALHLPQTGVCSTKHFAGADVCMEIFYPHGASPGQANRGGALHAAWSGLLGFPTDPWQGWTHAWSRWLRYAGRGGRHVVGVVAARVGTPARGLPWPSPGGDSATVLPGALPVHGAAGVHAQAAAHAGTGAAVVGTGGASIVGRPWVIT